MSDPLNQIEFTSPGEKYIAEVLPLSLMLYGKEVPELNFQEAAGLVGVILVASQMGIKTIAYGERVVADLEEDGQQALTGVLGHQVLKEFKRISDEGEEIIIHVAAIRTPEHDSRKRPPIEHTFRFQRLPA